MYLWSILWKISWDSLHTNVSESTKMPYLELLYSRDLPIIEKESNRILLKLYFNYNNSTKKWKTVSHGIIRMKRTNAAFIIRYQSFNQGVKKVKSDKRERRMKMGSVLRQRILHNFWTQFMDLLSHLNNIFCVLL